MLGGEPVTLVKQNGERKEGLEAQVNKDTILFDDTGIRIDAGDQIERELSNGKVELYDVIEPTYREGSRSLSHIEVEVQKGDRKPASEGELGDTYHFHGDNNRVNQNSVDQSINVASSDFGDVITRCRDTIENEVDDADARRELEERIADLEEAQKSLSSGDGTIEAVRSAYERLVAKAANHASLLSFCWSLARVAG